MTKRDAARLLAAFASGALFAGGLVLGGMTQPAKIVAFLDVAGRWDPTLALVMGGAVVTYAVAFRLIRRRAHPLLADGFVLPTRRAIDARLVGGAALFGVGWGLAGYCPGPALASLAAGAEQAACFVVAMLMAMAVFDLVERSRAREASPNHASATLVARR